MKDLSGEFWFAGDSVYVRALRSYGGDALPAEADAIARYGADAMCSIAYGIRSSMFEWRKGGKLLPGVGGFGPESIDELTAIAVSVAIPALVDWTDNPMLCVGAAGDYYTRRLRSVLPGAERVVDAIGRANVLDLATVFAEAAALTVAVAARHRVKLRVSEREIATTEMPKAVIVTRMTMEEPVLGGIGLAEMLKPLIRPDLGGTPANAAGVSTGHQFPLGMSQRAYERLTRFAFKSDDPAQQAGEIDARISDDGFDMKWHDMTVAQITAAILGRSAGRDWSDEAILRLAGAFVAGARLGEVAFGVTLPLGEPFASGDVVTQAHDLLPDSAEEALEFLQSHLPQPMQLWLVTASLRGIRDGLAPISADEASYPTLAAALAGMRWVAQAV